MINKLTQLQLLLLSTLSLSPSLFATHHSGNGTAFKLGASRCAGVQWKFTSIPEALKGSKCYPIERGDKLKPGKGMTVKLSAPTVLYLAVMERGDFKLDESWEKTTMKLTWHGDHVPFTDLIFKKNVPAGTFTVPEHNGKSGKKRVSYGIPHLLIVPSKVQVSKVANKAAASIQQKK